jgi:hypothetical protein
MDDQGSIERFFAHGNGQQKQQERWQSAVSELRPTTTTTTSSEHPKVTLSSNSRSDPNAELVRLNRACIRRFVNVFFAFYRTLHLWEVKVCFLCTC